MMAAGAPAGSRQHGVADGGRSLGFGFIGDPSRKSSQLRQARLGFHASKQHSGVREAVLQAVFIRLRP